MDNRELLVLNDETYLLDKKISEEIRKIEIMLKTLKEQQDVYKNLLRDEMATKGIKSIKDEVNGITITYIEPSERETFDSKRFREENEDLYNEYVNFTQVRDSIRISIK